MTDENKNENDDQNDIINELFGALASARREPSAELKALAANLHEVFRAYVDAGFTEPQAMQLVIAMATHGGNK